MKTAYPAIIHYENDEYWVEFPDLEGCFSDGETLADAASNASEALGMYLCSLMERNLEVPRPSDARSIKTEDGIVINGDEALIRQMTGLLLDNATKYAGAPKNDNPINSLSRSP